MSVDGLAGDPGGAGYSIDVDRLAAFTQIADSFVDAAAGVVGALLGVRRRSPSVPGLRSVIAVPVPAGMVNGGFVGTASEDRQLGSAPSGSRACDRDIARSIVCQCICLVRQAGDDGL